MNKVFGPKVVPEGSPAIPLLENNDTGRGAYISHIDKSPLRTKILVFALFLLLHIAVSAIMVWRISTSCHTLALALNEFHYAESGASERMKNGFWSWCWMFMIVSFDLFFFGALNPCVCTFIKGPLWYRLRHGFRETEVFFRAPTGKEYDDMLGLPPPTFQRVWQASLLQATDRRFTSGGPGFGTSIPPWEPCYTASMDAYRLAKNGVFDLKNWELSVWQKDEYQQWTVWETWRHQDPSLIAMAVDIIKENLRAQGKGGFVEVLEAILAERPGVVLAPLSNPATQEIIQDINTLFKKEKLDLGERWIEAMAEADQIRNQPQQVQ